MRPNNQRVHDLVVQALIARVAPAQGAHLIRVARENELDVVRNEIRRIASGGGCFRLVVGEHGSGKTFFLNLASAVARASNFVTADIHLYGHQSPIERSDQVPAVFSLSAILSTADEPEGHALQAILERFMNRVTLESEATSLAPIDVIEMKLQPLRATYWGEYFAQATACYCLAYEVGDVAQMDEALRALRGELALLSIDAGKETLNTTLCEQLKLIAHLARSAGYDGLLVCIDGLDCILRMERPEARSSTYNTLMQLLYWSRAEQAGAGFLLAAVPELLTDNERGIGSSDFGKELLSDHPVALGREIIEHGSILRLQNLTNQQVFALLNKIRLVYANDSKSSALIPQFAIVAFVRCELQQSTSAPMTVREVVSRFVSFMSLVKQYPEVHWQELLDGPNASGASGAS
jgi:hypothetical protein